MDLQCSIIVTFMVSMCAFNVIGDDSFQLFNVKDSSVVRHGKHDSVKDYGATLGLFNVKDYGVVGHGKTNSTKDSKGMSGHGKTNSMKNSKGVLGHSKTNSTKDSKGVSGHGKTNSMKHSEGVLGHGKTNSIKDSKGVFNVKNYGAIADGKSDSTKAFQDAWLAACAVEGRATVLIPSGDYIIGPIIFKGPCKGVMEVNLQGKLLGATDLNLYERNWIMFEYINGLQVYGGGQIDGQGALAWPYNKCKKSLKCKVLPMSLELAFVTNATISDISSINSKLFHLLVYASEQIMLNSLTITAPDDSPNTDGIHVGDTKNIIISNTFIGTGDDCISIGPGTENMTISNVTCGPGHGISVGSLGRYTNEKDVVGLTVSNCSLLNTTNGVRIKSWPSTGISMKALGFVFEDITMDNVQNPILIDQQYCPHNLCSLQSPSQVQISDVKFRNIKGTSATQEAIQLICSKAHPCQGVELTNVNLEYNGEGDAKSIFLNVVGK